MTEEEETKLIFSITFLRYKFIKFVAGVRVTQIPHTCPNHPSCCKDGWIWLVLTPQLLWFTAYRFINAHPGSFQLIVIYFAFPAMEEETLKEICFNHWSYMCCQSRGVMCALRHLQWKSWWSAQHSLLSAGCLQTRCLQQNCQCSCSWPFSPSDRLKISSFAKESRFLRTIKRVALDTDRACTDV